MTDCRFDRRSALLGLGALPLLAPAPLRARPAAPAAGPVTGQDARLTVEGRTAPGENGALRIGFPGVAVRFMATGTRIAARILSSSDDNWIDITLDDQPPRVLHLAQGPQEVVLHEGPAGRHRFQILKRTESWQGQIELVAIEGADALAPIPLPARRLMFIGDSITCGAATDVPDVDSLINDTRANDGAKSYGRVLARQLDAACHLVSYGGRGVIRDWQGIRDIPNAPVFYERAMPDDPRALWDHGRYVPHGIGICLGTNDFNQGVPDQNEFVNGYVELLRKVMRDAPAAHIFAIDSPMTDDSEALGHRRTIQRDYLDETVARIDSPRVHRARIRHYPGRPINSHPIASEHVAMAGELEPLFRKALGWD
jgi:hypothetical protein